MPIFVSSDPSAPLYLANQVGQQRQQEVNFGQGLQSAQFAAQLQQQQFERQQRQQQLQIEQQRLAQEAQLHQQQLALAGVRGNDLNDYRRQQIGLGYDKMTNEADLADMHERAKTQRFQQGDADKWDLEASRQFAAGDRQAASIAAQNARQARLFDQQSGLQQNRFDFQNDQGVINRDWKDQRQQQAQQDKHDLAVEMQNMRQTAAQQRMAAKSPDDLAKVDAMQAEKESQGAFRAIEIHDHARPKAGLIPTTQDQQQMQAWQQERNRLVDAYNAARENMRQVHQRRISGMQMGPQGMNPISTDATPQDAPDSGPAASAAPEIRDDENPVFVAPNGKQYTMQDVLYTAQRRGISLEDVLRIGGMTRAN